MKCYICTVWDGDIQDNVVVGVFSSLAKAFEAGSLYITEQTHSVNQLIDWEHDDPVYTDWYCGGDGTPFARQVTETPMDERLA